MDVSTHTLSLKGLLLTVKTRVLDIPHLQGSHCNLPKKNPGNRSARKVAEGHLPASNKIKNIYYT